jgi:hypothetical protein
MGKNQFENIEDSSNIWRHIYMRQGEKGLLEFSHAIHTPSRGIGKTVYESYMYRLAVVAGHLELSPDDFYELASKIPEKLRSFLARNKHCPEDLIEKIWSGPYEDALGHAEPDQAINYAFWNNHLKMISIYQRRPDLRRYVPECLRRLINVSLSLQSQSNSLAS